MTWMRHAGMHAWVDDIGNVHGRVSSANPDAPVTLFGTWKDGYYDVFLLLTHVCITGSHYDTVYDGGKFDGALGIVAAISAVKASVLEVRYLPL